MQGRKIAGCVATPSVANDAPRAKADCWASHLPGPGIPPNRPGAIEQSLAFLRRDAVARVACRLQEGSGPIRLRFSRYWQKLLSRLNKPGNIPRGRNGHTGENNWKHFASPLGKPATGGSVGVTGSAELDHCRTDASDRARSGEVPASAISRRTDAGSDQ